MRRVVTIIAIAADPSTSRSTPITVTTIGVDETSVGLRGSWKSVDGHSPVASLCSRWVSDDTWGHFLAEIELSEVILLFLSQLL